MEAWSIEAAEATLFAMEILMPTEEMFRRYTLGLLQNQVKCARELHVSEEALRARMYQMGMRNF